MVGLVKNSWFSLLVYLIGICGFSKSDICTDGDLRIIGGPNEFEGRLEYCKNSTWGHVCGKNWERNDALVVCRQMGFESSNSALFSSLTSYYGAQEGPAFINAIACMSGTEATLNDCEKQEINETGCSTLGGFAYVVCEDPACEESERDTVRLVDGEASSVGRVEVCDSQGYRRQVCQTGWDDQDATVICRILGFQDGQGAMALTGYELITVRLAAYNNVGCSGTEQDLAICNSSMQIRTFPQNECPGFAGVRCSEQPLSSIYAYIPTPSPSTSSSPTSFATISALSSVNIQRTPVSSLPGQSTPTPSPSTSSSPTSFATISALSSVNIQRTLLAPVSSLPGQSTSTPSPSASSNPTSFATISILSSVNIQRTPVSSLPGQSTPTPSPSTSSSPTSFATMSVLSSVNIQRTSGKSPIPVSSLPGRSTSTPKPTVPSVSDNTLLVIVVGSVGGALVVLLLLLVILFVLILLRRHSNKYNVSPESNINQTDAVHHGNSQLPPIPSLDNFESNIKEEFKPIHARARSSSDYDHVLLNPLYGPKKRSRSNTMVSDRSSFSEDSFYGPKRRSRSNTMVSDHSSFSEDPGYAEIKGLPRKKSPLWDMQQDRCDVHSTTSDSSKSYSLAVSTQLSPSQDRLPLGSNNDLHARAFLDQEGYAELSGDPQDHVYDEMTTHMYNDISQLSKSMRNNHVPIDELLLGASPYEIPAIPAYRDTNSDVLRGSLLSPAHKFGNTRSTPNLSMSAPQRGFFISPQRNQSGGSNLNIPSHGPEYRELEEIGNHRYDSPRNVRSYEASMVISNEDLTRVYEDPIVTKDVGRNGTARGYENPTITVTAEGNRENHDRVVDRNLDLETILEYDTL